MNKLEKILSLVDEYITEKHSNLGKDKINYVGSIIDKFMENI